MSLILQTNLKSMQLSLILRYVGPEDGFAREDLVEFIDCDTDISGQSLANEIIASLQTYRLTLNMLRVRCYQGCLSPHQSSVFTGSLPSLLVPLPKLGCCQLFTRDAICKMYVFFAAHPKRQRALEKALSDTQPDSSAWKAKDLRRTRCFHRIDALEAFQVLHQAIASCMEEVCRQGPTM